MGTTTAKGKQQGLDAAGYIHRAMTNIAKDTTITQLSNRLGSSKRPLTALAAATAEVASLRDQLQVALNDAEEWKARYMACLLYTSPSPRDA